jgi:putative PIN family toxin of toxin-antitoxin system
MSRENRYVFDTNVIVSALLFNDSVPGQAFFGALDRGVLVVSPQLVEQLRDVLSRDKFDAYLAREDRERLLAGLIQDAELIVPSTHIQVCRDPDDDMVLELAVSSGVLLIVTGDKDLLELNPFRGIRIIRPAEFLNLLDQPESEDIT